MKILIVGDIHFKSISPISKFNRCGAGGVSYELDRAIKSIKWVESIIKNRDINMIVQLGDIFHTLEYVDRLVTVEIFNSFNSLNKLAMSKDIPLYIISGNHDIINSTKCLISTVPCKKYFTTTSFVECGSIKIGFVPFMDSSERMESSINTLDCEIVFTHMQAKGVMINKYKMSEYGLDIPNSNNKLIISGHIHIPQWLGDKVYFVGSVYQQNPVEVSDDIPNGVSILDTNTLKIETIENTSVRKLKVIYSKKDLLKFNKSIYYFRVITDDIEFISYLSNNNYFYDILPPKKLNNRKIEIINIYNNSNSPITTISEYVDNKYKYLSPFVDKYFNNT